MRVLGWQLGGCGNGATGNPRQQFAGYCRADALSWRLRLRSINRMLFKRIYFNVLALPSGKFHVGIHFLFNKVMVWSSVALANQPAGSTRDAP